MDTIEESGKIVYDSIVFLNKKTLPSAFGSRVIMIAIQSQKYWTVPVFRCVHKSPGIRITVLIVNYISEIRFMVEI